MEDKLSFLVLAPSHVLEQISLDNFISFGEMLVFQMSMSPFLHRGGPWAYNREEQACFHTVFPDYTLCLMECGWSALPGPVTLDVLYVLAIGIQPGSVLKPIVG